MKKIFLLLASLHILSACVPLPMIVGGAAIGTGISAAKDRPLSEAVSDTRISLNLKRAFISNGLKKLYTKITVTVTDGRVLYTGTVSSEEDALKAVDLAWAQNGVKEVMNELLISEESGFFDPAEYSRDTWIAGKLRARMIVNRDIKFVNYTITVSKGIIYISGIARSQEEVDKVASLGSTIKGVKKVVIHAKING